MQSGKNKFVMFFNCLIQCHALVKLKEYSDSGKDMVQQACLKTTDMGTYLVHKPDASMKGGVVWVKGGHSEHRIK